MYKVFHDPEGTRCLEHNTSSDGVANRMATLSHDDDLETYKQRIQSLNIEVIRLNDEVDMVCT